MKGKEAMPCERIEKLFIDYRYGELPDAERREVAGHLSTCGACATAYCRLDADLRGVGEAVEETPGEAVFRSLRRQVEREFGRSRLRRLIEVVRLPIPAYQAALGLAMLAIVWALWPTASVAPEGAAPPSPVVRELPETQLDPTETPRARIILQGYDASTIVRLDPNLL